MTIVDTLPAGRTYHSASGQSSATIVGQTLTLNVGNLAAGASSTITVVVGVASTATGTITNTATVSGNQPDPTWPTTRPRFRRKSTCRSFSNRTTDLKIVKTRRPIR